MPAAVVAAAGWVLRILPRRLSDAIGVDAGHFSPAEVPPPPVVPSAPVRLYIAPVNFAGQGYEWARAAERVDGVGAIDMQYTIKGSFGFPTDNLVPVNVFLHSREWQRRQFQTVSAGFSHVVIEAERSIFGGLYHGNVEREVAALRDAGVAVAMLSHGSDLRLPSRHRTIDRWSPFHEQSWELVPVLEAQARRNFALLRRIGAPVFVSTPDLLLDYPEASWLPLALDPSAWKTANEPLRRSVPVVVHAPSSAVVKGTHLIDSALRRMDAKGRISYHRIEGVPATEIPALYRDADIVLEQFRIGTYSRAAVEGMAAGRIVVAHVHDQVREHVVSATGRQLPVVQATPDTLEQVLADILCRRDYYRSIARDGVEFVAEVHDGRASAAALRPFLLTANRASTRGSTQP
ncbi:Glycosyltransferase involved in cell wall bisynthesis [Paramicrobacterium humi]|uniref:Glycosyltransferase involved in cell wall bisynthesis n=2 Tax=Paramicrobacterium humi TaxID=640635 RepID=A0A1H4IU51_9MICO|nr:Glycosyltransferase involved in cell wall bisynthesis [Microbacterium humi]